MLVEAISKVILPWSYTKKAQIDAELLYCNLMLCGSKVALSSSLWLKYLLLMQPLSSPSQKWSTQKIGDIPKLSQGMGDTGIGKLIPGVSS